MTKDLIKEKAVRKALKMSGVDQLHTVYAAGRASILSELEGEIEKLKRRIAYDDTYQADFNEYCEDTAYNLALEEVLKLINSKK